MGDLTFKDNSGEVLSALEDAINAALEGIGNNAVSYAKQNLAKAHRANHGNLINSISHTVADQTVFVGTNTSYAVFHEYGTGIHAEGGVGRKTPWPFEDEKGEIHWTTGVTPTHFLRNAVQDNTEEFIRIAKKYLGEKMGTK